MAGWWPGDGRVRGVADVIKGSGASDWPLDEIHEKFNKGPPLSSIFRFTISHLIFSDFFLLLLLLLLTRCPTLPDVARRWPPIIRHQRKSCRKDLLHKSLTVTNTPPPLPPLLSPPPTLKSKSKSNRIQENEIMERNNPAIENSR